MRYWATAYNLTLGFNHYILEKMSANLEMSPCNWQDPLNRYTFNMSVGILSKDDIIRRWTIKIDAGSE